MLALTVLVLIGCDVFGFDLFGYLFLVFCCDVWFVDCCVVCVL